MTISKAEIKNKPKKKPTYVVFKKVANFKKIVVCGSSRHGTAEMNPTRNHEVSSLIPGLVQWVKDPELP